MILNNKDWTNDLTPAKRSLLEWHLGTKIASDSTIQTIPKRMKHNSIPLSFSQERLWFLDQFEPGNPAYNRPMGIHFTGQLNVPALKRTLSEILRQHEILRTIYPTVEGQPTQVITQPQPLNVPLVDLSRLELAEREARTTQLVTKELQRPFDLARGPVLRAVKKH